MTLRITLDETKCQPGQLLNASVLWAFDSPPSKLTLELSWHTTGKGAEDSETVFTQNWTPDSNTGEKSFSIQLPRGPISVRGNLISIDWQLECTSQRPKETCTMPFVLSHMKKRVQLTPIA